MSHEHDSNHPHADQPSSAQGLSRRGFFKLATVAAAGAGLTATLDGCASGAVLSTGSSSSSSSAWSFGILGDTQWTVADDGMNPYTCSVEVIRQINEKFAESGVKFVVHVGDLCDDGSANGENIRSAFAQNLYNYGIGFFPLRGNHDDGAANAALFQSIYPQTANGVMNATPSSALTVTNPDAAKQPIPNKTGGTFTLGSNYSSPDPRGNGDMKGLSYSCDVNNVRLILLDQFTPIGYSSSFNTATAIAAQQSWITTQLSGRSAATPHAFVFSHKGLITDNHADVLFGNTPALNATDTDTFISSLYKNNVKMFLCGHDHMHSRSLVYTNDGASASVMQLVAASDSSKFYTPVTPSNDEKYTSGKRQKPISQELYKIGYYIVTVEGNNATLEYYASNVNLTSGNLTSVPALNFTLRERWGYGLAGKQFQIPQGGSFSAVTDLSPSNLAASILAGKNLSLDQDGSSRALVRVINTGWESGGATAPSDILTLWGMEPTLGSDQCENYVLQMAYNSSKIDSSLFTKGSTGLATLDSSGNWTNAVNKNFGGVKKFVYGPWSSSYSLGTYGIDTANNAAWAVINYGGKFAVVNGI